LINGSVKDGGLLADTHNELKDIFFTPQRSCPVIWNVLIIGIPVQRAEMSLTACGALFNTINKQKACIYLYSAYLAAALALNIIAAAPWKTVLRKIVPVIVIVARGAAVATVFATRACFNSCSRHERMMSVEVMPSVTYVIFIVCSVRVILQ